MKKGKLYRQLLVNIVVPLVIGLTVLAIINYKRNLAKLHEIESWQRNIVYNQVKNIAELYDLGLFMYEENFDAKLKKLSFLILDKYKGREDELKTIKPQVLLNQFGMDSTHEDFYILNPQYTIVNTSFAKDSGLNFIVRDPDNKSFFDSMLTIRACHVDRFTTERITGNFKKYSYMPSANKKIILELGASSKKASEFKQERNVKVKEIKKQFPEMLQIQLLQASFDAKPSEIPPSLHMYYDKAIKNKTSTRAVVEKNGQTQYNDFLFLPMKHSTMFDGYIIHIVTDDSKQKRLVFNEVVNSLILFLCTLVPLIFILAFRARKITRPIISLTNKSKLIHAGALDERIEVTGNNEITELSVNFNAMIEKLQDSYETLEQKVKDRTLEVVRQKEIIEEKHKEITDSINYAERIQRSFMATHEMLHKNLVDYFIMFKPRDVVSGDFYWGAEISNTNFAFVTADSTGHGVPGAIMSLLNITSLEKAVEHHAKPHEILNHTRQTIINRLKKDGSTEGGKDGMDCSIVCFDRVHKKIQVAMANNPVWVVRLNTNGEPDIIELKPDKMPVGKHDKQDSSFTMHELDVLDGDTIYTLTDGYPDQFGGEKNKKFMLKNLRDLLIKNVHLSMHEQKILLEQTFKAWVGGHEQLDDVCVVGIRIHAKSMFL